MFFLAFWGPFCHFGQTHGFGPEHLGEDPSSIIPQMIIWGAYFRTHPCHWKYTYIGITYLGQTWSTVPVYDPITWITTCFFLNFWTNSPVVWLHSGWPVSPFRCSRTSRHAHCDIFNPMFAECQFGCFPARYPCLIMFASSMMLEVVTRKICGLVNQIS